MRLLFVGTNRGPGGTESHLVSLATAMADAGHEVAAVAAPGDVVWRALAAHGGVALHAGEFARKLDRAGLGAVRRAVRQTRPDWLLASFRQEYWGVGLVGRASGVPVAVFRHLAESKPGLARVLPRLVDRVVVPSAYLRDWLVAHGTPVRRVAVLHNPIDVGAFRVHAERRAAARAALGFTGDDVVVGYVGRMEPIKGVLVLADALERAMARAPVLRALWVGHGPQAAAVGVAITGSPFAARHVRRPWTDDVAACYAALDVLVLSSVGPESFGRVLVEAQAAGVPVVGSAIGGIPETMRPGETGLLRPPGDAAALAEALVALAGDPAERERMGQAGQAFVARTFDGPVVAAACAALLDR